MDDAEAALLREVEQIIDQEYATEEAIAHIREMFHLPRRQAMLSLYQIRANFSYHAKRAGMGFDEYVDSVELERKMAIFGFCVGAVQQRDLDKRRDPETGAKKPKREKVRPEYEI